MKFIVVTLWMLILALTGNKAAAQNNLVFTRIGSLSELGCRILTEAYQKIDIQIQCSQFPAERALSWSNKGKTDGEILRIKGIDKKYPNLLMIPIPLTTMEAVATTKHIPLEIRGWKSLTPYKIGIRRGIKFMEENTIGMDTHVVDSDEQLFELLNIGRIDFAVTSRSHSMKMIKKFNYKELKILEPPIVKNYLYHYLHKKHKKLIPPITAALKKMEKEGRFLEIQTLFSEEVSQ